MCNQNMNVHYLVQFPSKYKTEKLGIICSILVRFLLFFLHLKGAYIRPKIRPGKIPVVIWICQYHCVWVYYIFQQFAKLNITHVQTSWFSDGFSSDNSFKEQNSIGFMQECLLTSFQELIIMLVLDFSRWYTIANSRFWSNQNICKVWSCYVQWFWRRCIYK